MTEVYSCVICDGPIRFLRTALVAPFLAQRIWGKTRQSVQLVECPSCGFRFYNPRLDEEEADRLYAGYRSSEYQKMRQSFEPWYTATFNANLASPSSFSKRRRNLAAILQQHLPPSAKIGRILDYGGDRGDLVQELIPGSTAFVYDISGVAPVEGVTATADPLNCRADLIINSNVLEHISYPRRLVADIMRAAPAGGFVFIEAPSESPFGGDRLLRRFAQMGIVALARPRLAFSILRPASLYLMHEHINYLNEHILIRLMKSFGSKILAHGRYASAEQSGKGVMVWVLGTGRP